VQSIELTGADAMEKAAKMMADLRESVPESIGGAKVTGVRDYRTSVAKDLINGKESVINLPKSNVLEFLLGEQGSVIARPSGTEPKIKFYCEIKDTMTCACEYPALVEKALGKVEEIKKDLGL
jgi:phosphoglucomutase